MSARLYTSRWGWVRPGVLQSLYSSPLWLGETSRVTKLSNNAVSI